MFYKFDEKLLDLGLTPRAQILYAIMSTQLELSIANNWIDIDGCHYIKFSISSAAQKLGVTYRHIIRIMDELRGSGLIRSTNEGKGHPNRIYIYPIEIETIKKQQVEQKADDIRIIKTCAKMEKTTLQNNEIEKIFQILTRNKGKIKNKVGYIRQLIRFKDNNFQEPQPQPTYDIEQYESTNAILDMFEEFEEEEKHKSHK